MQPDTSTRKHNLHQRYFEHQERAADRTQLTQTIGSIAKGCFGEKNNKKGRGTKRREGGGARAVELMPNILAVTAAVISASIMVA